MKDNEALNRERENGIIELDDDDLKVVTGGVGSPWTGFDRAMAKEHILFRSGRRTDRKHSTAGEASERT